MSFREISKDEKKELIKNNIDIKNIKMFKYHDKDIYFYNIIEENIDGNDCWVNHTGITTIRPQKIIDFLCEKNIIKNNFSLLDIGCGLGEIGLEIERKFNNINYTGIDINKNLLILNELNLNKYKFIQMDITKKEQYNTIINNKYNIVCAFGAATHFFEIFNFISKKIKPNYIICESHIGRKNNLINIINNCKDYIVIYKYSYKFYNNINNEIINKNWCGYNRILYILKLSQNTLEKFPFRSPLSIAYSIKNIIKNKSICDLGCGAGDLLLELKNYGSSKIIGIEYNIDKYNLGIKNNRNFIKNYDFLENDLPNTDIYYIWIDSLLGNNVIRLVKKILKGKTIILISYRGEKNYTDVSIKKHKKLIDLVNYKEYIENNYFEYNNEKIIKKYNFNTEGTFNIHILIKK